ncbi:MAG: hypothetical protein L0I62_10235 [Gammaproteobacteria bacterium]|nr:hypothetical protein [Gammaproteobacteria bacterium]
MLSPALVWPGLDAGAAAAGKRLPRRFKRAEKRALPRRDPVGLAAKAMGIEPPPAGALARLADGLEAGQRDWFCAEPVMWVAGRDSLRMFKLDDARLDAGEADALIKAARAHFGDRLLLERGASGRWYAALEGVHAVRTEPVDTALGQAITPQSLEEGPDAGRLRAFLNELQMLWHEHPVNEARRNAGQPVANALWLWGCGRLPAKPSLDDAPRLRADEPLVRALAQWLGLECRPLEDTSTTRSMSDLLVVVGPGDDARGEAWLGAFASFRGAWRLFVADCEWRLPVRRGGFFRRA